MARSERYIPPSDAEIERRQRAIEARKRCDEERAKLFRAALKKKRKADVVELALRIAQEENASQWLLEREIDLDKPVHILVNDIEVAIDIATKVDERRLNYNFAYDWRAYEAACWGLSQLIKKGSIEEAKSLALELMRKGSCQIECSDEGLMQEEVEDCLRPVISAAADSPNGREWAQEMLRADSTGFLCERELTTLAGLTR